MEESESWLSEIVEDLVQRKVDTIVADAITGRAMPDPVTALLDLHNTYLRKLVSLNLVDASKKQGKPFDEAGWLLPNDAARKWLISTALLGMSKAGIKPADACVLQRIVSTCVALEPVVAKIEERLPGDLKAGREAPPASVMASGAQAKKASRQYYVEERARPDIKLTRKNRAALSKAWELGADIVALQTVAMLDGDIITRIAEQYTGDAHAVVRQIHQEAVETSLGTWDRLVNGVSSFFNGLLSGKR
jgi:hypothetical protein